MASCYTVRIADIFQNYKYKFSLPHSKVNPSRYLSGVGLLSFMERLANGLGLKGDESESFDTLRELSLVLGVNTASSAPTSLSDAIATSELMHVCVGDTVKQTAGGVVTVKPTRGGTATEGTTGESFTIESASGVSVTIIESSSSLSSNSATLNLNCFGVFSTFGWSI